MSPRFVTAALLATIACGGALVLPHTTRADDTDQYTNVQVSLPQAMRASSTSVMPGPTPATKYVVINLLRIPNISACDNLVVDYKDFALATRDGDYYYVNRKVTATLPFSLSEGVVGPRQSTVGSLAFQVPASLRDASLVYYAQVCGATYGSY